MGGSDPLSDLNRHLGRRLAQDGLAGVDVDECAVRQAINDLNHRLRYAVGEYPDAPTASLADRSSRPHRSPTRLDPAVVAARIEALRRDRGSSATKLARHCDSMTVCYGSGSTMPSGLT